MPAAHEFEIDGRKIGESNPVYFIADIAANHDGSIERAKELIFRAAEAGADAAKFQHFTADTIVSDKGFRSLKGGQSHQQSWQKSVFEVYKEASVSMDWTNTLKDACKSAGIAFFTSPYSFELVDMLDPHVPAHKIGSGDISWIDIIRHIAGKQKPYLLATGASSLDDVVRAVEAGLAINPQLCLMQCNTNYTGSLENLKYVNLNVLKTYQAMYPSLVLGLSDHTPGHATVLGSVALGARVIEKHFTDDVGRTGPDHAFSMDAPAWRQMVDRCRELEAALGHGVKKVEKNEMQTVVLQRRAICAKAKLGANTVIRPESLTFLRPCPEDGIPPYNVASVLGRTLARDYDPGEYLRWSDLI